MTNAQGNLEYTWDGVNMMTTQKTSGGEEYAFLYTVDDERVAKFEINAQNEVVKTTWTARGLDNNVLRTWESTGTDYTNWTWKEDHVYRGGSLLASVDAEGTKHYHLDHLGSPRLITDENREMVAFHSYFPFGEEATAQAQDSQTMKFTGHERDLLDDEPGNQFDYMHARYYAASMGRFLSVDPVPGFLGSPKTMNQYSYARNRPIVLVDPDGRCPTCGPGIAGAALGFVIGFSLDVGLQALGDEPIDFQHAAASGLDGAVVGGAAGLTLGGSFIAEGGGIAVASVIGGAAKREYDGDASTEAFDPDAATVDLVTGFASGSASHYAFKGAQTVQNSAGQKVTERVSESRFRAATASGTRSATRQAAATARHESVLARPLRVAKAIRNAIRTSVSVLSQRVLNLIFGKDRKEEKKSRQ